MFKKGPLGCDPKVVDSYINALNQSYAEKVQDLKSMLEDQLEMKQNLILCWEALNPHVEKLKEQEKGLRSHDKWHETIRSAFRNAVAVKTEEITRNLEDKLLSLKEMKKNLEMTRQVLSDLKTATSQKMLALVEESGQELSDLETHLLNITKYLEQLYEESLVSSREAAAQNDVFPDFEPAKEAESREQTNVLSFSPEKEKAGTALVVDDSSTIRSIVRALLEREGYEVLEASDGREALDLINTRPPCSLVILDIMLPFADGRQIAKTIRSHPDWYKVPIIALSANSAESEILSLFEAGVNDYVTKPFSPLELGARVRRFKNQKITGQQQNANTMV